MLLNWLTALIAFFTVAFVIYAIDLAVQLYRTIKQRRILFAAVFYLFEGEHYANTRPHLISYLQVSFKEHLICNLDHDDFTKLYDHSLIERYYRYKGGKKHA